MLPIEDLHMRQLFGTECHERLQKLDAGWLQLEKEPANATLVEDLFREAHSLKGAARMLGLLEIQDLAHGMEDALGQIRQGSVTLRAQDVQQQLQTLDQLRHWVALAVSTEAPAAAPQLTPGPLPAPGPAQAAAFAPAQPVQAAADLYGSDREGPFRIDTVRVGADRLDALLSQTGELVVCRNHVQRLNAELNALLSQTALTQHMPPPLLSGLQNMAAQWGEDSARLSLVTGEMAAGIRTLRLLPAATLLDQFPRMVHDLSRDQHKKIDLKLQGGDIVVDKHIIEEMKAPLMHLLRNAIDHGLENPSQRHDAGKPETGSLTVRVYQEADRVCIDVRDDGQGLDLDAVRALVVKKGLYTPADAAQLGPQQLHLIILDQGFSTRKIITDVSGRGVGLNVVRTTVERLHGTLSIDSVAGQGMWITMALPVSLISSRVLLVSAAGQVFAIPFENVVMTRKLSPDDVQWAEGRPCMDAGGDMVFLSPLSQLLNLPSKPTPQAETPYCVVLSDGPSRIAIWVDALLSEQEVVIKPSPFPAQKNLHLVGVTILDSGVISPVLNVRGLSRQVVAQVDLPTPSSPGTATSKISKRILLAEDSITTRMQEKRILEDAGYDVIVAVDGLDAWSQLSRYSFDAVVSDIMMPTMSGLELTEKIRAKPSLSRLPVILITTLNSDEDRRRGLEAGADAYLSKPEFDQTILLECLERLL